ncbi:hypothetical protein KSK37_12995 [Kaistella sp. DKR-2]|uniref:hypothetical protein n=1 Tax=Kaistella soli TaxID=2849654 RepID=UPI001C25F85E|nr:hypothetical protein [Kaistella soli]MBU8884006.1 hypothetical protein [Kaistella soli]
MKTLKVFIFSLFTLLSCCTFLRAQNWIFKYNLSESDYQKAFDQYATNYIPVDINVTTVGKENRFSVIFYKNNEGRPWQARHELSSDDFDTFDKGMQEHELMPYAVTPYFNPKGELRFGALWFKGWSTDYEISYSLSAKENILPLFSALTAPQAEYGAYWINSLAVYDMPNGENQVAFVLQTYDSPAEKTSVYYDIALDKVSQEFEKFRAQSYLPLNLSVYHKGNKTKVAALMLKLAAPTDLEISTGLSMKELEASVKNLESKGYRPFLAKGYEEKGALKYLVAWRK